MQSIGLLISLILVLSGCQICLVNAFSSRWFRLGQTRPVYQETRRTITSGRALSPIRSEKQQTGEHANNKIRELNHTEDGMRENQTTKPTQRCIWSPEMDKLLVAGHSIYTEDWKNIAAHVGPNVTSAQCRDRWARKLGVKPNRDGEPWTTNDMARLRELVQQHTTPSTTEWDEIQEKFIEKKGVTSWGIVGAALQRRPANCRGHWTRSIDKEKELRRFEDSEDRLIQQRVQQWGHQGIKTWTSLAHEMNRTVLNVRQRWRTLQTGRTHSFFWNATTDAILAAAMSPVRNYSQAVRAMHAAGCPSVTLGQCRARWTTYTKYTARLGYKNSALGWAPAEDEVLVGMLVQQLTATEHKGEIGILQAQVTQLVGDPKSSLQQKIDATYQLYKAMKAARMITIQWTPIGHRLLNVPGACADRWRMLCFAHLQKGSYTPQEDALILARVRRKEQEIGEIKGAFMTNRDEWAGFWTDLEKEIGRSATSLHSRYFMVLYFKE